MILPDHSKQLYLEVILKREKGKKNKRICKHIDLSKQAKLVRNSNN